MQPTAADPTLLEGDQPEGQGVQLQLGVISDAGFATYALPAEGAITIGRGTDVDIVVDDPLISRRHVQLHLGSELEVQDLASANGTRLREERLAPNQRVGLSPGDTIGIGTTLLVVQRGLGRFRPRRVWTHGYLEGRLEEECLRAQRSPRAFALLRIHAEGKDSRNVVFELLGSTLRPSDVLASYGPEEYEALLLDTEPQSAEELLERSCAVLSAQGLRIRGGVASYPRDGRSAERLVARTSAMLRAGDASTERADPIVLEDDRMPNIYRLVERVAASTINVLILGETGVGKEVLTERLHGLSPRAERPLLRLNCAALSETLLESELFGHERGAFTGAVRAKEGLLESADGGTVFLDEVGELPPSMQAKLLRVIEARQVTRVGGLKPRSIDVRFVAATNRDLEAEIARGTFRSDLFFRLNGFSLIIPPLRERVSEIEGLARRFLEQACRQASIKPSPAISTTAMEALRTYSWPGNIRELRNMMERAVLLSDGGEITREHLPVEKMESTIGMVSRTTIGLPSSRPGKVGGSGIGELPERARIIEALTQCAGNQTQAARLLGISRRTLVSRLASYNLPRPRKPHG